MYEMAFVSSSKARLETLSMNGSRRARIVLDMLKKPEQILSTIQVGITLVGIISGLYGGVALADDLSPFFERIPALQFYARDLAYITVVAIITYASLIIGELVPKSLALSHPERLVLLFTPMMRLIMWLGYPIVLLLSLSTTIINKILRIDTNAERAMTEDELKFILHKSRTDGIIDDSETEMIREVFRFTDKRVKDLMTNRREVVYLKKDYPIERIKEIVSKYDYSKYVVLDEGGEGVIGVLRIKDLMFKSEIKTIDTLIKETLFVPENLLALNVMELFRQSSQSIAVVVDEHGAFVGIITLHDLMESILGDFPEKQDDMPEQITACADGSFIVSGSVEYVDLLEELGLFNYEDLKDKGFTRLSGLAMFILNRVPQSGDKFEYKNLQFEILSMEGVRIRKIKVNIADTDS